MKTRAYGDFSAAIVRWAQTKRIPIGGVIEMTRRCSVRCAHCYNNLPMGDPERHQELTREEHERIIDELSEAGCLWLLYTGGEIFARKDFLDIYRYASNKGMLITLFTNGTLITDAIADELVRYRPFNIEITLLGATPETHDRVAGVSGAYERCWRGIRLLVERKLPLKLKTVVLSLNQHELPEMKRRVEEELGLQFKYDAMVNGRIDGLGFPQQLRLPTSEIARFDSDDKTRRKSWQRFADDFLGQRPEGLEAERLYQCGGGVRSFSIDPCGMLSLCPLSRKDVFDLREGSFNEGWNHFLADVIAKKRTTKTRCDECFLKATCSMCPAMAELEHGDPEKPVDFCCEVTHQRAKEMGWLDESDTVR